METVGICHIPFDVRRVAAIWDELRGANWAEAEHMTVTSLKVGFCDVIIKNLWKDTAAVITGLQSEDLGGSSNAQEFLDLLLARYLSEVFPANIAMPG